MEHEGSMSLGPTPRFLDGEYGFSGFGVDALPGKRCGIQRQSYPDRRVSLQELGIVYLVF